jgi:hypothetical protein
MWAAFQGIALRGETENVPVPVVASSDPLAVAGSSSSARARRAATMPGVVSVTVVAT